MTLGELIQYLQVHPYFVVFFFTAIPLGAFLANVFGKGEGDLNPWCYFYTFLVYLAVIPGTFAILLNFYHLLFENTSIYDINLMVQVLPVISMVLTLYLIRKNVAFERIPGFDKISSFAGSIAGIMIVLFVLNKLRIVVFSYLPIIWLLLILIGLYFAVRYAGKWLFTRSPGSSEKG